MISEHERLEALLRDLQKNPPTFLHLMQGTMPDMHERKRLEVQAIPFALPEKGKPA